MKKKASPKRSSKPDEEIKKDVVAYIGSFANMPVQMIKDEHILKNHPLKLDDTKLGFLAGTLRNYVQSMNPGATVLASELRKKDMDVKKTCALIIGKINAVKAARRKRQPRKK